MRKHRGSLPPFADPIRLTGLPSTRANAARLGLPAKQQSANNLSLSTEPPRLKTPPPPPQEEVEKEEEKEGEEKAAKIDPSTKKKEGTSNKKGATQKSSMAPSQNRMQKNSVNYSRKNYV